MVKLLHLVSSTAGHIFKSVHRFPKSSCMEKNPTYWDADNVKISKVKLTYYDGQDSESLIRGFDKGDRLPVSSQVALTIRV